MRLRALILLTSLSCDSAPRSGEAPATTAVPTDAVETQSDSAPASALLAAVAHRFPEYRVLESRAITDVPAAYVATQVTVRSRTSNWPYGTLVIVGNADTSAVWISEHRGDFGPHTFSWYDANDDGLTDLLIYGGEEDVMWTRLYLRARTERNDSLEFIPFVYDSLLYLTVLDIGADGTVEYIGDAPLPPSGQVDTLGGCEYYNWPPDIATPARAALARARRVPGVTIIDYNMPGAPHFQMHFPKPVRFSRLSANGLLDVTREYPQELQWYLDGVNAMRGRQDSPACNAELERTAGYLRDLLKQ